MKKTAFLLILFACFSNSYAQRAAALLHEKIMQEKDTAQILTLASQFFATYPYSSYLPDIQLLVGKCYAKKDKEKAIAYFYQVIEDKNNDALFQEKMSKNAENKNLHDMFIPLNYDDLKYDAYDYLKKYYWDLGEYSKALELNKIQAKFTRTAFTSGGSYDVYYVRRFHFQKECEAKLKGQTANKNP